LDASKTKTAVEGENCLGGKTRRGTPDLKATQAYPLEFGCAHALKFQAHDLAKADDEHVPVAKRRRVDSRSASADMVHGFLPSRLPDASERTLLDDLSDMSDEEDPWFLDDLKTGNPGRWHNNATSENTLSLPGSSAWSLRAASATLLVVGFGRDLLLASVAMTATVASILEPHKKEVKNQNLKPCMHDDATMQLLRMLGT
jgi:hypothetical protein